LINIKILTPFVPAWPLHDRYNIPVGIWKNVTWLFTLQVLPLPGKVWLPFEFFGGMFEFVIY